MSSWKRTFEGALWNSRLVVLFAVITSILAGMDLFVVVGLESLRVLVSLAQSASPSMAFDQKEALFRQAYYG